MKEENKKKLMYVGQFWLLYISKCLRFSTRSIITVSFVKGYISHVNCGLTLK